MGNNHNSIDFRLMRSVALWLHEFRCNNCNEINHDSHVHHLNHDSSDNNLRNLAPMCASCHELFHRIPRQPYLKRKKIIVSLLRKVEYYSRKG